MARILVVEDDQNTRYLITMNLGRAGYEVDAAENGILALEMLSQQSDYDVILSDVKMPGMDGLKLLELLKQDYPHIPVIMLSVSSGMDWVGQAAEKGATCSLLKPFTHNQLLDIVRDVVESEAKEKSND